MKLYAQTQAIEPSPVKGVENASFTISDLLVLLSLLVAFLGLATGAWNIVLSLIRLTNKANEIKNEFTSANQAMIVQLKNLTDKVELGFSYTEKRIDKQERLMNSIRARLIDAERHLAKGGYVARNMGDE